MSCPGCEIVYAHAATPGASYQAGAERVEAPVRLGISLVALMGN